MEKKFKDKLDGKAKLKGRRDFQNMREAVMGLEESAASSILDIVLEMIEDLQKRVKDLEA